eukprot:scaffold70047_cov25-Prasinocladus_malaysianus.AAC.1
MSVRSGYCISETHKKATQLDDDIPEDLSRSSTDFKRELLIFTTHMTGSIVVVQRNHLLMLSLSEEAITLKLPKI